MRKTFVHCCWALLAAAAMTAMLLGTVALAAGPMARDGGTSTSTSASTGTGTGSGSGSSQQAVVDSITPTGPLILEVGSSYSRQVQVRTTPDDAEVTWTTSDSAVVSLTSSDHTATVTGLKPGEVTVTASVGDGGPGRKETLTVSVSGIEVDTREIEVKENERKDLPTPHPYGAANGYKYTSSDPYIAQVIGSQVVGYEVGETTIIVSDLNNNYKTSIPLKVVTDPSTTIDAGELKLGDSLPFASLGGDFRSQLSGKVDRITNLSVSTAQGTLYYRYNNEGEPGMGVGNETYYVRNVPTGQRDLMDVTFVPKPSFAGGQVEITYTATTTDSNTYACRLLVDVVAGNSNNAGVSNISLTTRYNTAVRFEGIEFDRICRERMGNNLDYVTFSLPSERQGTLYTDYVGEGNYGGRVTLNTRYSQRNLDDVWFVPAPGYEGTVTIYYTAWPRGGTGKSYTGQVVITVGSDTASSMGGLAYDCAQGGSVTFDDADFDSYCKDVLDRYQRLSYIRFTALPDPSQGTLYYDYRSSSGSGSAVSTDNAYYYGTYTPRIDRLSFAAAEGFYGTIRIPFVGVTADGTQFSGNAEINVRSGAGRGDIHYTCRPGRTVSFSNSDFTSLCRTLTGRTLDYIQFQSLPGSSDGNLYYNNTRITSVGTRYSNGTGNRISNLSFRASNSFSGSVNISFVGRASGTGDSFSGVITIDSSDSGGSTARDSIRYSTDTRTAAVFYRNDFDNLSQWETDRDVSTVRFEIPGSSQGTLYQDYRSSNSMGTRISSSTTSISASGLDRVAFVPANGYAGTVYLDFTARAANGEEFTGTVEISVERPGADVTVRYSTRTAPVGFWAGDFGQGNRTLTSIQFGSMPPSSAGYLYYQYVSPTRYGRQAGAGTTYRVSGSNLISDLTFVPRAGYSGTVTIPYTGTNSNNSTFEGEVVITVSPSTSSAYFNDMAGYSDAQRAAVDYLRENGITSGISANQFGPEYSITRADFAVMLYQAFGLSSSGSYSAFQDVPSNAYYAQAVNTLRAMGVVSGIGNGVYGSGYTVSRQDAICMVQRTMRAVGWNAGDGFESYLSGYSDGYSVAGYAQGAMARAVQMGYLPISNGRLAPRDPLTRVDMAQIIHRVLTY